MTTTPYDGQIALVHWDGRGVGENTIDDIINTLQRFAPNVKSLFVKTSDGINWQGDFDTTTKVDLRIQGPQDLARWVQKCGRAGIAVHAWAIPKGLNVSQESRLIIEACRVAGVRSMILDVEVGQGYFRGGPQAALDMGDMIRRGAPIGFHIGLCLDARGNHPRDIHIQQWLPFIDSLHPMVYHVEFGLRPTEALDNAFSALSRYNKPIIPMLQAYNLDDPDEIAQAGDAALRGHAARGISYYRLGTLGPAEFRSLQKVVIPDQDTLSAEFAFTNQQLLDAIEVAAKFVGESAEEWLQSAGLEHIEHSPTAKYHGVSISQLPGLTQQERQLIQNALEGKLKSGDVQRATTDDPVVGKYTNQQIINAFFEAARQIGQRDIYFDLIESAGLASIAQNRNAPYQGSPIPRLPNLDNQFKRLVMLALRKMPKIGESQRLDVPWVSQLGANAPGGFDCGQACVLMLLRYYMPERHKNTRVIDLTNIRSGRTTAQALVKLAARFGLTLGLLDMDATRLDDLRNTIANGRPVILLVNYLDLGYTESHLSTGLDQGLHWIVVHGYEGEETFIFHDPLWGENQRNGLGGADLRISTRQLARATQRHPAPF
ncbi:MAG: hypothetical protein CUN55_02240 [Phototrophicales bacterium]|nr:MAG: hypothetical protein CUN55_02240 [Phototrophicales bacterium]